jgi:hypothetical protein
MLIPLPTYYLFTNRTLYKPNITRQFYRAHLVFVPERLQQGELLLTFLSIVGQKNKFNNKSTINYNRVSHEDH